MSQKKKVVFFLLTRESSKSAFWKFCSAGINMI